MKNLGILLFVCMVVMGLGSCKTTCEERKAARETNKSGGKVSNSIEGTWNLWRVDCCGRTKGTRYVKGTEEEKTLTLKDGQFSIAGKNVEKEGSSGSYILNQKDLNGVPTIKLGQQSAAMYYLNGDTLTLSWEYMDLQVEMYLRNK